MSTTKNIKEKETWIIAEFSGLEDWSDAYEYIIKAGKSLPIYPQECKTDNHLIKGCQSKVWLKANYYNGKVTFLADSDTTIIKGIIAILIQVLSDNSPSDIVQADLKFMEEIGLRDFLAPTRANGLVAMVNHIKDYASQSSDL